MVPTRQVEMISLGFDPSIPALGLQSLRSSRLHQMARHGPAQL